MGDLTDTQADMVSENYSFTFTPKDAISTSFDAAKLTGGAGLLVAAVQNTLLRENIGAFGVFTRFGSTVALFAGMGGAYAFVSTASANLRQKNDPWNHFWGGMTGGALLGLRRRTIPSVLGNGLAVGVILAATHVAGANFIAEPPQGTEDKILTKEEIRRRFRRPIQETINEIGEGRGIYGPGYEERRKERIKQNYGIEVQEPYYKSS